MTQYKPPESLSSNGTVSWPPSPNQKTHMTSTTNYEVLSPRHVITIPPPPAPGDSCLGRVFTGAAFAATGVVWRIGVDLKSTLSHRGVAVLLELHHSVVRDLCGVSIQLCVSLGSAESEKC